MSFGVFFVLFFGLILNINKNFRWLRRRIELRKVGVFLFFNYCVIIVDLEGVVDSLGMCYTVGWGCGGRIYFVFRFNLKDF